MERRSKIELIAVVAAILLMAGMLGIYGQMVQDSASNADQKFADYAVNNGMLEVAMAEEAASKSTNRDVKALANRIIQYHSKVDPQLTQLSQKEGFQVPTTMDTNEENKLQNFSKLNGPKFDSAYIGYEINDNKADIKEFTNEANAGNDPGLKAFASQKVPQLQQHLSMAESVNEKFRATQSQKYPWWEFWKKI